MNCLHTSTINIYVEARGAEFLGESYRYHIFCHFKLLRFFHLESSRVNLFEITNEGYKIGNTDQLISYFQSDFMFIGNNTTIKRNVVLR